MLRLDVLTLEPSAFPTRGYFISSLSDVWTRHGLTVRVAAPQERDEPGDIAILHIDRTVIDHSLLDATSRYARVVNCAATDISKRVVSSQLVRRDDDYDGPVIIKTNANCGGLSDREPSYSRRFVGPMRRRWDRRAPYALTGVFSYGDYPILPRKSQVRSRVWEDERLVVERFLPERQGSKYIVRTWVFLGDHEICRVTRSDRPVVKSGYASDITNLGDVPEELRRERDRLGLDYGKMDYVIHDGSAVLLDANTTPTVMNPGSQVAIRFAESIAPGLWSLLP